MSTVTCPHCGVENEAGAAFCASCGQAVPQATPTMPQVITGEAVATTTAGRTLQADQLHKQSRAAFGALLAVAILQFVAVAIIGGLLKGKAGIDQDAVNLIMLVTGGVGVLFIGLAIWARKSPLPAAIVGLVVYVTLIVIDMVADPSSIARGIIIKVIIVVCLVRAIQAGVKFNQFVRATGQPGAGAM